MAFMPKDKTEEQADSLKRSDGTKRNKRSPKKSWKIVLLLAAIVLLVPIFSLLYLYTTTPPGIRNPKLEHYHFRMQILVDGKAENFADAKYQEGYAKDQCTSDLPDHPIHFHDQRDQMVHIHWEGMTGGIVMKYYGWNFIGGPNDILGYNVTSLTSPKRVPIHGKILPNIPAGDKFFIYTGDEHEYKERTFNEWNSEDLEHFFGVTSNFPAHKVNTGQTSLLNWLLPKAEAHDTSTTVPAGSETEEEKLTRINNLLGNVVIFVQKDQPTDQQIKNRFANLVPLEDSTCGG